MYFPDLARSESSKLILAVLPRGVSFMCADSIVKMLFNNFPTCIGKDAGVFASLIFLIVIFFVGLHNDSYFEL